MYEYYLLEQDRVSLISDQWQDAITYEANYDGECDDINSQRELLYFITLLWTERSIRVSPIFSLDEKRAQLGATTR